MGTTDLSRALDGNFYVGEGQASTLHGADLRAEAVSAVPDSGTAIDLLYMNYAGRHATAAEITDLTTRLASGATTLQSARAAILASADAQQYVTGAVSGVYQSFGGRAATSAEGATVATIRAALVGDLPGRSDTAGIITRAHQLWGDRAPTPGDLAAWQDMFRGGLATPAQSAMQTDPLGIDHATGVVTAAFQQSAAQDPLPSGIGGYFGAQLTTLIAPAPATTTTPPTTTPDTTVPIVTTPTPTTTVPPTTTPDTTVPTVTTPTPTTTVSPTTTPDTTVPTVTTPTPDTTVPTVTTPTPTTTVPTVTTTTSPPHSAIDPAVLTHVYDGFAAFLGRAPTETEASSWSASVQADGTGLDTLRSTVLAGGEGQAYLSAQVTAAYQQLANRAPTGAEIATWQETIANQGGTVDAMRHAIVDSADGLASAGTSIAATFSAYLGRAPTVGEAQSELAGMAQGRTIEGVAAELFTSVEGILHFNDTLATLFPQLLGHDASQADSSTWFAAIAQGATYDTMRATLMLDPASTAIHMIGTTANDRFTLAGAPGDVTVSAFDAANDRIALDLRYSGVNLLDAAHATQVLSLDGETPNVLIRLDDHDTLLLHGTTLAQLSSADFVFA